MINFAHLLLLLKLQFLILSEKLFNHVGKVKSTYWNKGVPYFRKFTAEHNSLGFRVIS